VPSAGVVEAFDELEDADAGLDAVPEVGAVQEFGLEGKAYVASLAEEGAYLA
jgi:hypothetical protein